MTEVSVEKYLLYALQQLKTLEEDMSVLTTHSAKADPEIIEELLDEIITRTMVPALEKLGVEDPLTEIQEEIDPSDIFEEELERITDELEEEEEEEEEEEAALID